MSVGGLQGCFPGTFLDRRNLGASAEGWPVMVSHAVRPVHWQLSPYTTALFATWDCYLRFTQYTTLKGIGPWAENISHLHEVEVVQLAGADRIDDRTNN